MMSYIVTITAGLHQPIDDEIARDAAARWAAQGGFALGMTSVARDEPWLRVSGGVQAGETADLAQIATSATGNLAVELAEAGHRVERWHAIEVVSAEEQARRKPVRAMPDVVNATELAELAGLTRQRIYQYESDRRAGKRDDFPAPILEGYWLRSTAERWVSTRRRKPASAHRGSAAQADNG